MTGVVGVVAEHDGIGVALEEAGVLVSESGAKTGDCILKARCVTSDDVNLAFSGEGRFFFAHGLLCPIESEEDF